LKIKQDKKKKNNIVSKKIDVYFIMEEEYRKHVTKSRIFFYIWAIYLRIYTYLQLLKKVFYVKKHKHLKRKLFHIVHI